MMINLTESDLFTTDPAIRFSREYGVPKDLWDLLWRRRTLMGYTTSDVQELFRIRTNRKIGGKALRRWFWRTEVYSMVAPFMRKGVRIVNSELFKHHEARLIEELAKNARSVRALPPTFI